VSTHLLSYLLLHLIFYFPLICRRRRSLVRTLRRRRGPQRVEVRPLARDGVAPGTQWRGVCVWQASHRSSGVP
jgi:hypothetical protein